MSTPEGKPTGNPTGKSTGKFVSTHFDEITRAERYFFMTSTIVPRPISIVGTIDEQGRDNLAPFSYFNAISSDPPALMFSMGKKKNRQTGEVTHKDTLANILKNKEFVVHIAQAAQVEIVDHSGEEHAYGVSEREKLGLTLVPSRWIKVPRVSEFAVAYECVLEQTVELGANTMVIGRVLGAHIREDIKIKGEWRADFLKLDPLARLGREYGAIRIVSDSFRANQ
ncbi:MAG: flavin reductase family protein [Bdellovibrionales bacterium]|nr:flavin reductase family protein [Bdellovibrionales bacterium]